MEKEMIEEILVSDREIFGTEEEQSLTMEFFDGYAREVCPNNARTLTLQYPTINEVMKQDSLRNEVKRYCGIKDSYDISFYSIALRFGELKIK